MKKILIVIVALAMLASCTSSPAESAVYEKDIVQTTYLAKPVYKTTHQVEIFGFSANPDTIKIKKGDRITFTNNNGREHRIVEESLRRFESPWLKIGESYTHTFNKPGIYNYEIQSRHTEFNTQKRKRQGTQRTSARVIVE